jgi:Mor family transcriptional regulator
MSYLRAEFILPKELLELIQEYADGQYIYIPRKSDQHRSWGERTDTKLIIRQRDREIYSKYMKGATTPNLAIEYYLSPKSIQRIILKEKRNDI